MIVEAGFPEGLKLTYSWHCESGPCSPCSGDVGSDESQGRSSVGTAVHVSVGGVANGFFAVELG